MKDHAQYMGQNQKFWIREHGRSLFCSCNFSVSSKLYQSKSFKEILHGPRACLFLVSFNRGPWTSGAAREATFHQALPAPANPGGTARLLCSVAG